LKAPNGIQIVSDNQIKKFLQSSVTVLLGTQDIDPNHKSLNNSVGAIKQGKNRLERGK